uniref:Uncharacterized protein n=1 Tax=Lepeophtheirus salmonis TaxID=72036 RepID=A0A0K2VHP5_LEPSM
MSLKASPTKYILFLIDELTRHIILPLCSTGSWHSIISRVFITISKFTSEFVFKKGIIYYDLLCCSAILLHTKSFYINLLNQWNGMTFQKFQSDQFRSTVLFGSCCPLLCNYPGWSNRKQTTSRKVLCEGRDPQKIGDF